MSTAAALWRHTLQRAADLRRKALAPVPRTQGNAESSPVDAVVSTLVQRLFFSAAPRRRILFVGVDSEIPISGLCERVGSAVAEGSRASVVIVTGNCVAQRGASTSATENLESVRDSAVQLTGNLWQMPFLRLEAEPGRTSGAGLERFDYVILEASITDPTIPCLCERCDAAVLVITANRTRRETVVHAKDLLLGYNVELLGAVLDKRTFPVPESIYRRL